MKNSNNLHRTRTAIAQLGPILILITAPAVLADPVPYRFVSLYQQNAAVNAFDAKFPSINNLGAVVALLDGNQGTGDPHTLVMFEGRVMTKIADVLPTSPGGFANASGTDINDAGQVVVKYGEIFGGFRGLRRYERDGTFVELVTGLIFCEMNDFCEINLGTINNSGQVTAKTSFDFGGDFPDQGIYLFDDTGPVELARYDAVNPGGLFNLQDPSINDSGVVAFGSNAVAPGLKGLYSATVASPPILEAALSIGGGSPINSSGQIAAVVAAFAGGDCSGVVIVDGGVVTTIKSPNECGGVFQSQSNVNLNNPGAIAFKSCGFNQCGIFTGGDETNDVVVRDGDALFGGSVINNLRLGNNALNDLGEIVLTLQVGATSHLVRAIPLSPAFDSEGDGIANDVDNCLIAANPGQIDTDGDGFGNMCDSDLTNDGATNFEDLGLMKSEFFGTDPDADLNGDGQVNFLDLGLMKKQFFLPPGPSALVE